MDAQLTTRQATPDPLALIEKSNLSEATKGKYSRVLSEYLNTGNDLGDAGALVEFAGTLSPARRAHLKAAVGRWSKAMVAIVKGQATPENVAAVQASVYRFEAIQEAVKVEKPNGSKTHTWLSADEVVRLSNEIGNGIQGARDRVVIGLLVAGGLRRLEAVNLTWDDIKLQPVGEKMRTVLAIEGKGKKKRTVPISDKLANDLDRWAAHLGAKEGRVLRGLGRLKEPTDSLSAVGLFKIVQKYGRRIDKPELAPHDLRRTFAKLAYNDGKGLAITQISLLLGHSDIQTTMTYLGVELDLEVSASDFIPW